ncbi:MAG: DUF2852 domain-containing protein [Afipia birgiae]|jgi:hypothetical protein|nr:DUF2852 domain-containing protein [Afipia birgiae]
MANTANANTARLDRWGRPDWAGPHHDNFESRDDWRPRFHPGRIILIVAGFIIWWPLGLAALAYTLWSRNMGCWSQDRHGRWADKMERMQYKMERMRSRMEGRGYYAPSSGNRAFDDYRMETLRRLEEEQTEFKDFLDRLRHAKDKEEFDAFMAQHKQRPTPPNDQPQG